MLEHFLHQIFRHVRMAAGKGFDEAGNIFPPAHRKARQLEPGNPALCARLQGCNFLCGQVQPHRLVEEIRGFFFCEAQISRTNFGQLPP